VSPSAKPAPPPEGVKSRGRFEWVPGRHQPHPVRTGLIVIAVAAVVAYSGFTVSIPFVPKGGTEVTAVFTHAANTKTGTPVRVHGVKVGEVIGLKPGPGGRGAAITMRIEDGKGVTVKQDAHAAIWWRTLLGRNMYIELDPGSPSAPKLGSGDIPVSRTTSQVELDELAGVLDPTARKAVQTTLREFDRGFAKPEAVGGTIDNLAPAMKPTAAALTALRGTEEGDLNRVVTKTSRVMGSLARDEGALGGLIDGGSVALGVTAAHRAGLGQAIQGAPASLRQTRATAVRLRTTLDVLDPVVKALRPGVDGLAPAAKAARPALNAIDQVLAKAQPLLLQLRPTSEVLSDLVADAEPAVADARPLLARTQDEVIPFLEARDPDIKLRNYEAIGPTLSAVASATQQYDQYGHVIRFEAGASEELIGPAPCTTLILDPTSKQKINCDLLISALSTALGVPPAKGSALARAVKTSAKGAGR
jgi:virulence factor Mce-like protein